MAKFYGYIRTSIREREGERGMNSDSQRKQLLDAGVDDFDIYADVAVSGVSGIAERNGWKALALRLKEADTLVIAALDRIGRNHVDTWGVVSDLNRRKVRIRSLAEQETFLRALDADPSSPEWFAASLIGQVMAWGASQEREAVRRRTIAGLQRVRANGQQLGRQFKMQEEARAAVVAEHRAGASTRSLAKKWGVSRGTVRNYILREELD